MLRFWISTESANLLAISDKHQSRFRFLYGTYADLHGRGYIGYDLEALFYDAVKGVNISKQLILGYYSYEVFSAHRTVSIPIQEFVASEISEVLNGNKTPERMFKPQFVTRPSQAKLSPAVTDLVEFQRVSKQRGAGVLREQAGEVGEMLGLKNKGKALSASTIEQFRYTPQAHRNRRIAEVAKILRRFYSDHKREDANNWCQELGEIYRNVAELN